jgi:cob(I)alamin adenosyltransferase
MEKGKITVFAGDGRGKTAAALGLALDAAADGRTAVIIQFLKGRGLAESIFCKRMEPDIKIFRFEKSEVDYDSRPPEQKQDDVSSIRNSLGFARKVLMTGECDILVLDEVLGVIDKGIISVEELHDLCKLRGDIPLQHFTLKGLFSSSQSHLASEQMQPERVGVLYPKISFNQGRGKQDMVEE